MKYKISLSVGEIPAHKHTASTNSINQHGQASWMQGGKDFSFSGVFADTIKVQGANVGNGDSTGVWKFIFDSNHSHSVTINNTGSGNSHNNLSPYLSLYIWQRIS